MLVRLRRLVALGLAVMLVATACSNDGDLAELLEEEGIDFNDLADGGDGEGDGNGIDLSDLTGDLEGSDEAEALLEELLGTTQEELEENPFALFCNDSDLASAPADWPFMKPPSMYASAYEMLGTEYRLRGTSDDSAAVIAELRNQFAGRIESETTLSTTPGAEAFELVVTDLGTLDYGETSVTGCATILISLRLGLFPSEEGGTSASSSSDAVAEGDGSSVTTETIPAAPVEADVAVVAGGMFYEIDVADCQINFDTIAITSTGDVMLTVSGSPSGASVVFSAPGVDEINVTNVPAAVPFGGSMILSEGDITVTAGNCDS